MSYLVANPEDRFSRDEAHIANIYFHFLNDQNATYMSTTALIFHELGII